MGVEGMPNFNPILRSTKPIASQYQAANRAAYARKKFASSNLEKPVWLTAVCPFIHLPHLP